MTLKGEKLSCKDVLLQHEKAKAAPTLEFWTLNRGHQSCADLRGTHDRRKFVSLLYIVLRWL